MNDRHLKLKDAIEVVRETVADEYIESTLELRLLDKSLTADVVEVVRCKDCRHFRDRKLKLLDDIYECDLTGLVTKPDNYCNYGEGV